MLTKVEQLLLDLLHIPSETGDEVEILKFLENKVPEIIPGIQIKKLQVDEQRYNLLFSMENFVDVKKLLVAHVDTVPGQLEISYDDENIYGRGACDNKNSVAAMITALQELIESGEKEIGMLCTVGEESTFDGAQGASEELYHNDVELDLVVVGEPTQEKIVTAQKGVYALEISCKGTQEHSSSTNIDSAIHKLVSVLGHLQNFDNKNSIMNIGLIDGGVAENIVAGEASATIVWRTDEEHFSQRVKEFLGQIKNVEFQLKDLKVIAPKKSDLPQFEFHEVNYFSEMYFFENSIVCGAGNIAHAHTKHEHIKRGELNRIVDVYKNLMKK